MRLSVILLTVAAVNALGDVTNCVCDTSQPAEGSQSGCSLSRVARQEPEWEAVFLVKDNSPLKPHRWLALPRSSDYDGAKPLPKMPADVRLAMWSLAVQKGKDLFGNDWAVAMNSDERRLQCHLHVHIGKLLAGQDDSGGVYIDNLSELPTLSDGTGFWFHEKSKRLHVHTGGAATEYVLEN